jgi:hypothetical protein
VSRSPHNAPYLRGSSLGGSYNHPRREQTLVAWLKTQITCPLAAACTDVHAVWQTPRISLLWGRVPYMAHGSERWAIANSSWKYLDGSHQPQPSSAMSIVLLAFAKAATPAPPDTTSWLLLAKCVAAKVREGVPTSTAASVIVETAMTSCDQHVAIRKSVLHYISRSAPGLSEKDKLKTVESMTKMIEDKVRMTGYTTLNQARTPRRAPGAD